MDKPNFLLEYDSSFLCQKDVKTKNDLEKYKKAGYLVGVTVQEFIERVNIDPSCIYYGNRMNSAPACSYYNRETMAACCLDYLALHLLGYPTSYSYTAEDAQRIVQKAEQKVAQKDYAGAIEALPDGARLKYFKYIAHEDVPGLYQLFLTEYCSSNVGCGDLDAETWNAIINSKTQEDIDSTTEAVQELPDIITAYRGGNTLSTPYDQSYSWTMDINQANFFATRLGAGPGYIAIGHIKKEHIIEYWPDNGEREVIVAPNHVEIDEVIDLPGQDFIYDMQDELNDAYYEYKAKLDKLKFTYKSTLHGPEHEMRVLFLVLILAKNLPREDVEILATAAIYHDTRRTNDEEDPKHGKRARNYYRQSVSSPDPIVEFLCEYHSLPDKKGYSEIERNTELNRDKKRVTQLYNIFKDADSLGGNKPVVGGVDMKQLRLKESMSLVLVARLLQGRNHDMEKLLATQILQSRKARKE